MFSLYFLFSACFFGLIENISHMARLSHFAHFSSLFQVKCVCFLLLWTYLLIIALSKSQLPIKDAIWFAFSSWPPFGWKFFIYFWTFKLIGFFGEGTFKKDPEAEHLVAGGLVWQCSLFSWNQSSGSVEITGPFSSLVTLCFILVCKDRN